MDFLQKIDFFVSTLHCSIASEPGYSLFEEQSNITKILQNTPTVHLKINKLPGTQEMVGTS
jgi:hypothetical protein